MVKGDDSSKPPAVPPYPPWAPRFWHGMSFRDWLALLRRNRFRVHPLRWGLMGTVSLLTLFNSVMKRVQHAVYSRALARSQWDGEILFILGHWRSGTTLLHELLVVGDRFGYPTTYECFAANHFLLTGGWMPRLIWFLLPAKRPMDDMALSFQHPQEDEFALISLGAPSPLLRTAFPNEPPPYLEFLDMEGTAPADLARWRERLSQFVSQLGYAKGKDLVLKSPTHTGRVELLAEMFPRAKFLHITRDPYQLFSSTRRLWWALDTAQGLQIPREEDLDEYVFTALERMYGGFERQRTKLAPQQIYDVRYEDLIRDPTGTLQRAYEHLGLGDFSQTRTLVEQSMKQRQSHQTNRHQLPEELRTAIRQRWSSYFERYGYE